MRGPEEPAAPALEGYGASSRIRAALPQMPQAMVKIGTLLLEKFLVPSRALLTKQDGRLVEARGGLRSWPDRAVGIAV